MLTAALVLLVFALVMAVLSRAHRAPVTVVDERMAALDAELDGPSPQVGRMAA